MAWNKESWLKEADVRELTERLVHFGRRHNYKPSSGGRGILELEKTSTLRLVTGLTSGVRIVITSGHGETTVVLSEHIKQFGIKVPVFLIAAVMPILLAFPAYGVYQQYMLLDELRKEINDYFHGLD